MDTKEYYNQESHKYSTKRYEGQPESYVKYFFKKRLALLLGALDKVTEGKRDLSVLDIGCADGYVLKEIYNHIGARLGDAVGVDIAEKMLEEAREICANLPATFVTNDKAPVQEFDLELIIGFLSAKIWESDKTFFVSRVKKGGYVFVSLAARGSLHAIRNVADKEYYSDYKSYAYYENMFKNDFEIVNKQYYGLFIPKLWSFPKLARVLQPLFDYVGSLVVPSLMHECLYVLQKK